MEIKGEYCPVFFYEFKLPPLPCEVDLLQGKVRLAIDLLRMSEVDDVLSIIHACAERELNVSLDEYVTANVFVDSLVYGFKFVLRDAETRSVNGVMIITTDVIGRALLPTKASVNVFVDASLAKHQGIYGALFALAEEYALTLRADFSAVSTLVSITCLRLVTELSQAGYLAVGCVPGCFKEKRGNLTDCVVLYKSLRQAPQSFHLADVTRPLTKFVRNHKKPFEAGSMRNVPFLPVEFTFTNGAEAILRNLRPDETSMYFDMIHEAGRLGHGFGLTDQPTLEIFQVYMLAGSYSIVAETKDKPGDIIALLTISHLAFSRTSDGPISDSVVVVNPSKRVRKCGHDMARLWLSISKDLGFHSALTDLLMANAPAKKCLSDVGFVPVAVLPRNAYVAGKGWHESVLYYQPLSHVQTLAQFAASQKLKATGNVNATGKVKASI